MIHEKREYTTKNNTYGENHTTMKYTTKKISAKKKKR